MLVLANGFIFIYRTLTILYKYTHMEEINISASSRVFSHTFQSPSEGLLCKVLSKISKVKTELELSDWALKTGSAVWLQAVFNFTVFL